MLSLDFTAGIWIRIFLRSMELDLEIKWKNNRPRQRRPLGYSLSHSSHVRCKSKASFPVEEPSGDVIFSSPEFSCSNSIDVNKTLLKCLRRICDQSIASSRQVQGKEVPQKNEMFHLKLDQMIKVYSSLATSSESEFPRTQLLLWTSVWVSDTHHRSCMDRWVLLSSVQNTKERTGLFHSWWAQSPNRLSSHTVHQGAMPKGK